MQQGKQTLRVRLQLLARLTLNAGKHTANQPARLAHLDDGNDRAILVQGNEGPAQIVRLGHRATPSIDVSDEIAILAARPIASLRWRGMDSKFQFRAKTGNISTLRSGWGRSTVDADYPSGRRPRQTDRPVSAARSAATHRQMNAPTLLEVASYCGTEISQFIPLPAASLRTFGPWAPEDGISGLHRDHSKMPDRTFECAQKISGHHGAISARKMASAQAVALAT